MREMPNSDKRTSSVFDNRNFSNPNYKIPIPPVTLVPVPTSHPEFISQKQLRGTNMPWTQSPAICRLDSVLFIHAAGTTTDDRLCNLFRQMCTFVDTGYADDRRTSLQNYTRQAGHFIWLHLCGSRNPWIMYCRMIVACIDQFILHIWCCIWIATAVVNPRSCGMHMYLNICVYCEFCRRDCDRGR